MEIKTKYNIGQRVFCVEEDEYVKYKRCSICKGKNTSCINCEGTGQERKKSKYIISSWIIDGVSAMVFKDSLRNRFHYYPENRYIGSCEDSLFLTKKEAESCCKKLNKEKKK